MAMEWIYPEIHIFEKVKQSSSAYIMNETATTNQENAQLNLSSQKKWKSKDYWVNTFGIATSDVSQTRFHRS